MNKLFLLILIISFSYLLYIYWKNKFQLKTQDKCNSICCPIQKNIKKIDLESDDNYQLTEGALNQLDDVFDTYIQSKNRTHVFFDIEIQNEIIGRIIIELFDDIVPKTVANFIYMVENNYRGSTFHRIIKDFVIQGGDYINGDGTGSNSIYGGKFEDENFDILHESKYLLSMANSGPNTNGCQFFITLNALPHLDNKHVVFGKVVGEESFDVVDKIENIFTNINDNPIVPCIINDCGIIENVIDI